LSIFQRLQFDRDDVFSLSLTWVIRKKQQSKSVGIALAVVVVV